VGIIIVIGQATSESKWLKDGNSGPETVKGRTHEGSLTIKGKKKEGGSPVTTSESKKEGTKQLHLEDHLLAVGGVRDDMA